MLDLEAGFQSPTKLRTPRRIPRKPPEPSAPVTEKPSGSCGRSGEPAELSQRAGDLPRVAEMATALLSSRFPGLGSMPANDLPEPELAPPNRKPFSLPPESEIATVPPPRPAADAPRKPPQTPEKVATPAADPAAATRERDSSQQLVLTKHLATFDLLTCGATLYVSAEKFTQDSRETVLLLTSFLKENAADPGDFVERIILENILMLQQRTARLHARSAQAESLEKLQRLNTETERMSRELRGFIQTLHQHRAATRRARSRDTEQGSKREPKSERIA